MGTPTCERCDRQRGTEQSDTDAAMLFAVASHRVDSARVVLCPLCVRTLERLTQTASGERMRGVGVVWPTT